MSKVSIQLGRFLLRRPFCNWFTLVIKLDGTQIRGKIRRKVVVTIANLRKGALGPDVFNVPAGFKEAPHRKR